ncbi:MAG TPA: hypothetical protein VF753_17055, partial [Terriglobales bacterium]
MSAFQDLRSLSRLRPLQLAALTAMFTTVGVMAMQLKYFVLDSDIWWHLKVGDWIISHFALPHTGILSRTAANLPWVAYSWGYEVILSRFYAWFGLIGLGVFGTLLTLALACAIYWMMLRLSANFWFACIGAIAVYCSFLFNGTPRPFFFSMILFTITLTWILDANRSGRVQHLYWLPLVFFLWANIHIQFIYGLFLLGLFVGVNAIQRIANALDIEPQFLKPPSLPLGTLIAIFTACFAATLIGPNFYHPYVVVFEYSKAKFSYNVIIELQPLSFRGYSHYMELLIAGAGFYAVGWQKKLDLFKLSLLTIGSVVAFRTMRDAWFIVLPAAACAADAYFAQTHKAEESQPSQSWPELAGVAAAVAVLLAIAAGSVGFTQRDLDRTISNHYPVNAINFLRRNPAPGPLYNNLNWGGFLMWYMPDYPVAIDGRNDLYGDTLDELFFNSQNGAESYT